MTQYKDYENLLELDGTRFVIDEHLGLWVKFDVTLITPTAHRPHGIRYSLTLHDRSNQRIMGFDNAHAINYKYRNKGQETYDHVHYYLTAKPSIYIYKNAVSLLEDFWRAVDQTLLLFRGQI
ncbi:MAG: DUF6516 family protein [Gammaproteobacteria bacterium]